jgi:hypothetical protein
MQRQQVLETVVKVLALVDKVLAVLAVEMLLYYLYWLKI